MHQLFRLFLPLCLSVASAIAYGQDAHSEENATIRAIYDEALLRGESYENLRYLCKQIGHRITGSAEAEMAVHWGKRLLSNYGFDTVYLQPFTAPHWERGTREAAWMMKEDGSFQKLRIAALGGSPSTDGLLEGELVHFNSPDDLEGLADDALKGKIAFFSQPFDQSIIYTFEAYGGCISLRWTGAVEAAKRGASAVLIRSLAQSDDDFPHTGSMRVEDDVVPAAALSTRDADRLKEWLKEGKVRVRVEMDCGFRGEVQTHNVIAEWKGREEGIITWGGHLDSWDMGEGAHDDGAGVIHSIEAMRLLKQIGYQPKYTLRCVLFMNEENGNYGGKAYARYALSNNERHVAALESDRGGFMPVGFDLRGSEEQLEFVRDITGPLLDYRLWRFEMGYGGVDIGPLYEAYPDMLQLGLNMVSQRYFDYHHADSDVFETVNKRELELGCAAMASMIYLLDKNL